MDSYRYIVSTNPASPEQEAEYNDWYDSTHVPDMIAVPGFVAAQRFAWAPRAPGDEAPAYKYLAIYEIETDDLKKTMAELFARAGTPQRYISPALGKDIYSKIYKAIGPRRTAK